VPLPRDRVGLVRPSSGRGGDRCRRHRPGRPLRVRPRPPRGCDGGAARERRRRRLPRRSRLRRRARRRQPADRVCGRRGERRPPRRLPGGVRRFARARARLRSQPDLHRGARCRRRTRRCAAGAAGRERHRLRHPRRGGDRRQGFDGRRGHLRGHRCRPRSPPRHGGGGLPDRARQRSGARLPGGPDRLSRPGSARRRGPLQRYQRPECPDRDLQRHQRPPSARHHRRPHPRRYHPRRRGAERRSRLRRRRLPDPCRNAGRDGATGRAGAGGRRGRGINDGRPPRDWFARTGQRRHGDESDTGRSHQAKPGRGGPPPPRGKGRPRSRLDRLGQRQLSSPLRRDRLPDHGRGLHLALARGRRGGRVAAGLRQHPARRQGTGPDRGRASGRADPPARGQGGVRAGNRGAEPL
ncbi:MAG: N-acyl-L-amino acid amidohydrolase, partial [uncultured Thermomicrobiales bacterium]